MDPERESIKSAVHEVQHELQQVQQATAEDRLAVRPLPFLRVRPLQRVSPSREGAVRLVPGLLARGPPRPHSEVDERQQNVPYRLRTHVRIQIMKHVPSLFIDA